jgi:Lrp/AsnC family leucine-responsive transcriptional regulator
MALDPLDRRILFRLDLNSRATYSELGRLLRVSPETVRYRVERLRADGVIQKCTAIVDVALLGLAQYKIWLKLQSVTEKQIDDVIKFLTSHARISWVVRAEGEFDVGFAVCTGLVAELYQLMEQLITRYSPFISRKSFYINVLAEYLSRDYLIGAESRADVGTRTYASIGHPVELDETGWQIVQELVKECRTTAADIAEQVRVATGSNKALTPEAISARIKKIREQGIVTGYTVILNHAAFDQTHFKVFLYLNRLNKGEIDSFIDYCKTIPNIVYVIRTLGEWEVELDLEVRELKEYRNVMMDLTRKFPAGIRDYTSVIATEIAKYSLLPSRDPRRK